MSCSWRHCSSYRVRDVERKDVEGRGAEGWSRHKSQIFKRKSAELKDNVKRKVIGRTVATYRDMVEAKVK